MNQPVKRTAQIKPKAMEVRTRPLRWTALLATLVAIQVLSPACAGQTSRTNIEIILKYSPQGINVTPWEGTVTGLKEPVTVTWKDETPAAGVDEARPRRRWEIRWAPAKPTDAPAFKDYFGAVTFEDRLSGPVQGQGLEIEEDVWPYSVTLLEEVTPGRWQVLAFRDPRIRWRR